MKFVARSKCNSNAFQKEVLQWILKSTRNVLFLFLFLFLISLGPSVCVCVCIPLWALGKFQLNLAFSCNNNFNLTFLNSFFSLF